MPEFAVLRKALKMCSFVLLCGVRARDVTVGMSRKYTSYDCSE